MQSESITQAIEQKLSTLGRIWVAEYLHAGAVDERLNRELFEKLTGPKPPSIGQWVALARRIRHVFKARGLATVVEDLAAQDFGEIDDRTHTVSRLIDFRNTIDHGGLTATEADTREHRSLLDGIANQVPALSEQPILFRTEDGRILTTDTRQPGPVLPNSLDTPPLQPFIVSRDAKTVLKLYPLLHVTPEADGHKLLAPDPKKQTHPISTLFERETLRDWAERYQREKKGHLGFDQPIRQRSTRPVPQAVLAEVTSYLKAGDVSLLLVEAHPGCGKAGILTHLREAAPSNSYPAVCLWLVEPGDLGLSGITFVNFLLRRTESSLGLAGEALGLATPKDWDKALATAKQALTEASKRLLVGIEDLHSGWAAVGEEPVSVADVYRALAGGPITVVATAHPGRTPGRLPFDRLVRMPVPAEADIALDRLDLAARELCPPCHPMRQRVMQELIRAAQPMTLFAVCEALETGGNTVFEPAVERALWDLRPLLSVDGTGDAKTWSLFTPALTRVSFLGGAQ